MFFGYILQTAHMDLSTPRGPQIHVVRIAQSLRERGHRVRLVQLADRGIRWTDDLEHWSGKAYPARWRPMTRLVERPVRLAQSLFKSLPYFNYFDSLRFADAAKTVLDGVDVLYERYNFMSYGGVLLSRMLGVPLLLEVNGHPFDETKIQGGSFTWQQKLVSMRLTRWTMQHADMVLPSGYGWKQRLVETGLLTHDRINVVWPGINIEEHRGTRDVDAIRRRWSLQDVKIVAFTGSFDPWQGLSTLVTAFAQVCEHIPDVILVLAGDGFMRTVIEDQAAQLECNSRIHFFGMMPQTDVADLLAIADIGVMPIENHAEFVGMKLFDYMASGIAVVVTAPQCNHDLIVHEENGLVVEPGDVRGLAAALERLLSDTVEYQRLGRTAQALVRQNHTWLHRADEIESIAISLVT